MKLYVLDLGKIVMRGDNPVVDTAQANAEAPAIPIHAFLADTPVGKILFDTGCHPKAMEGAWPPEMCTNPYVAGSEAGLLARLAQIDVRPEDISIVVASHLHLDHSGGLHLFPQAKVYVQQWELERVLHDADAGTLDVFHLPCDVENWKAAGAMSRDTLPPLSTSGTMRRSMMLSCCSDTTWSSSKACGRAGRAPTSERRRL